MLVFSLAGSVDTINLCTARMKKDSTLEMVTVSVVIYKVHLTPIMSEECILICILLTSALYSIAEMDVKKRKGTFTHM